MIETIQHGDVRELRLHRPPVNALSGELMIALRQALEPAPHEGVRALILSGSPGRFSGGLDVPFRFSEPLEDEGRRQQDQIPVHHLTV